MVRPAKTSPGVVPVRCLDREDLGPRRQLYGVNSYSTIHWLSKHDNATSHAWEDNPRWLLTLRTIRWSHRWSLPSQSPTPEIGFVLAIFTSTAGAETPDRALAPSLVIVVPVANA